MIKKLKVETRMEKEERFENGAVTFMKFSVVGAIVLCGLVGGCTYLNQKVGLEDDNFIEQSVEALLLYETGVDLDLTPGN